MEKLIQKWVFRILVLLTYVLRSVPLQARTDASPAAAFTQDKTQGCLPLIVSFTDQSTGSIASYFWDFGDGTTSILQNPSALYNKPGNFDVKLVVTDIHGVKDSIIKKLAITVFANPVADFSASPTSGCEGLNVNFTNLSKATVNPIVNWSWDFGDGTTSTTPNPAHTYATEGVFAVSLVIVDLKSCKHNIFKSNYVQVGKPVSVSFTSNTRGGCTSPQSINFTNTTYLPTSKTYSFQWDFGDGKTDNTASPSHTYTQNGNYNVSLSITDNRNCKQTLTMPGYISIGKTVAAFTATHTDGCTPFNVTFNSTSQGVPFNAKLKWYFGNGDTAVGDVVQYTYNKTGTYTVTLEITSPTGCNDKIVKTNYINVTAPPKTDFTGDSVGCSNSDVYHFYANAPGAEKWEWDFGDHTTSDQANPVKKYTTSGIYNVSLKVTYNGGCVVTVSKPGYAKHNTLAAGFNVSDTVGCVPMKIKFTNTSTSLYKIVSYKWTFGDGQTSTSPNAEITYTKGGTYHPELEITDAAGCTRKYIFNTIKLGEKANPDFYATPTSGCKQDMRDVIFYNTTDVTTHKVDSFRWLFGYPFPDFYDSAKWNDNSPMDVHDYFNSKHFTASPDYIDVVLISFSNGCRDTIIKKQYIKRYPPDINVDVITNPCKPDSVLFENHSVGADEFHWFLDGQEITGTNTIFRSFLLPGSHNIAAYGKNTQNGCRDSLNKDFLVDLPLHVQVGMSKKTLCMADSVMFSMISSSRPLSTVLWTINGISTSKVNFYQIFMNPGSYTIKFKATDYRGCTWDTVMYNAVTVIGPNINARAVPDTGCFPLASKLVLLGPQANSFGNITWTIDGDSYTTSNDTMPFVFDKVIPGMNRGLPVTVEVSDANGCSAKKEIKVFISKPAGAISTAFNVTCQKTELAYYSDYKAGGAIGPVKFDWKLDDSSSTAPLNRKDYYTSGTHSIRLYARDSLLGCVDSAYTNVYVPVKRLKAGFIADKTQVTCPPLVATFTDNSQVENTYITQIKWSFGDGSTSVAESPLKTYFFPGNYHVVYVVTDSRGCTDSATLPNNIFVGGPKGDYHLDRYTGCVPFEVVFTAKNANTTNIRWDFDDGGLVPGNPVKNTYVRPGTYHPSMILQDKDGCVVVYPVKDPVIGYPSPVAAFTYTGRCFADTFKFRNLSDTQGMTTNFVWKFDDNDSLNGTNTAYRFKTFGKHKIDLKATSINGCVGTRTAEVDIKVLKASFTPDNKAYCRDELISLTDNSESGAGIKEWVWKTGDGRTFAGQHAKFSYNNPGQYDMKLLIEDNSGCFDSTITGGLIIFDTLVPPPPTAYRVTVEENNTLRFEFSKYPRPDFGKYLIYKNIAGQPLQAYKEIGNLNDTVFIDNAVSPDDYSYTYKVVNESFCGRFSADSASVAHTSILLKSTKDINKVHLSWSQYGGWEKVKYYHIYRKTPTENTYTKLATVDGNSFSYTDTSAYCKILYKYYVLAEKDATVILFSRSNTRAETPVHISNAVPGSVIRATVEDDKNIRVEFAGPMAQKTPVILYTLQKSPDGFNYKSVYTTDVCCPAYIDKKVDVHSQSYYYRLLTTDFCSDVSDPSNIGKSILLDASIDGDENISTGWNTYRHWDDGVNRYELELMDNYGNFNLVKTNNNNDTGYTDIFGNYNYMKQVCYRVRAVSNTGIISYSNIDCVTGHSSLFAPNAFTPNDDDNNRYFKIVGSYIKTYELDIYNRWGQHIYTSTSLDVSWDGTYKGAPVPQDVYIFIITALGMDGKHHNISGNVTLLR